MKKPLRNKEIVWRVEKRRKEDAIKALTAGADVDDHGVVTLIQAGMMHQLNLVGGMIWERCDGSRTLTEIVDELAAEFAVDRDDLQADVEAFVADLQQRGWLVDG